MSIKLSIFLDENIKAMKKMYSGDQSVIFREFENKFDSRVRCCIVFTESMANKDIIDEHIIKPIMNNKFEGLEYSGSLIDIIDKTVVFSCSTEKTESFEKIEEAVGYGNTVLMIDGEKKVLIVNTISIKTRSIEESSSEMTLRGSREGFTESINDNISMIKKRIKSCRLKLQFKEIGEITRTKICVCYIEGIAQKAILDELMRRLDSIKIDGVLESSYIEEFIRDEPYSGFKTVGSTERPDVVCAKLLEGRIAVICDGTPFVLTVPYIFMEMLQSSEDYYVNYIFGSFNRILRWFALFLSTSVPALYVSFVNFHQELLPTKLLISISISRQGVPFPTTVEAIGMLIVFEILREAGTRIPKYIGQAVSIVGALVLGEAAVNARFVSAPMVIVTAISGISDFLLPKFLSVVVLRFALLILSSILGLFGYISGVILLLVHLMSIRSFGVPYMLNLGTGPIKFQDIKDTAMRVPWFLMKRRTEQMSRDVKRQK